VFVYLSHISFSLVKVFSRLFHLTTATDTLGRLIRPSSFHLPRMLLAEREQKLFFTFNVCHANYCEYHEPAIHSIHQPSPFVMTIYYKGRRESCFPPCPQYKYITLFPK